MVARNNGKGKNVSHLKNKKDAISFVLRKLVSADLECITFFQKKVLISEELLQQDDYTRLKKMSKVRFILDKIVNYIYNHSFFIFSIGLLEHLYKERGRIEE